MIGARRSAAAALAAAALAALGGCGGDGAGSTSISSVRGGASTTPTATTTAPPAPGPVWRSERDDRAQIAKRPRGSASAQAAEPGIRRIAVGRGASSALVLRPRGAPRRPPGVVFLHGWGGVDPQTYGAWLRHLVAEGNEVILPRYQLGAVSLPSRALPDALRGIAAALRRAPIAAGSLVVAGHSGGGALAADYAAVARAHRLPRPLAIYAVFPGRRLPRIPIGIPERDAARIPAATRILALASPGDDVVGTATARRMVAAATRVPRRNRRLVLVRTPGLTEHLAPLETGAAARRTFWAPLDALIARVRR